VKKTAETSKRDSIGTQVREQVNTPKTKHILTKKKNGYLQRIPKKKKKPRAKEAARMKGKFLR